LPQRRGTKEAAGIPRRLPWSGKWCSRTIVRPE
jgi:hypothetical protein